MTPGAAESVLHFDEFTLDIAARRLLRAGRPLELRPKSFDLLAYFATHAGRALSKDELFAAVWPGVVVTDDSLVQCVGEIRQVLGDQEQRLVKTLPRRGYFFAASPASRKTIRTTAPRARGAALGVLLLLALAFTVWLALPPKRPLPPLSIVVMPLANEGDAPQAYLAQWITEELTLDLSRIPSSFVIASSSAYAYRDKTADPRVISRDLGVRYVLQGTVRRTNDEIRLGVQLIDGESARQLWSERFVASRAESATLAEKVTGTIARTLQLELVDAESQRARRERSVNVGAEDLAMQAWSLFERRTPDSVEAARRLLHEATSLDSNSVLAWSLLSETYTTDLLNRWVGMRHANREEWLAAAAQAADRAYGLDPRNLYAIGARATVMQLNGNHRGALDLFEKQVALNRNYAPAWHRISYAYAALGDPERSLAAGHEAIRLSPSDGRLYSFFTVMAAACLHAGRDEEALEWTRKAVQSRADFAVAYAYMAAAAAQLGRREVATAAIGDFRRLQPEYTIKSFREERVSDEPAFRAQHERFFEGLRKAGLPE